MLEYNDIETCSDCIVHRENIDKILSEMPLDEKLYDLADFFKTFGDTTRIKILYALMQSEMCVCDIAETLNISQSAISHQLRILKQAKLVKYVRDGKSIIYSLDDEHIKSLIVLALSHLDE